VLVALEQAADTHLVGFAAIGPADESAAAPDEPALDERTGAVNRPVGRAALGPPRPRQRLLAAAVDLWRAAGDTRAVAWSFERDPACPPSSRPPAGNPTAPSAPSTSTAPWSAN